MTWQTSLRPMKCSAVRTQTGRPLRSRNGFFFWNPVMRLLLPAAGMITENFGIAEPPSLHVVLQVHEGLCFAGWNLSRDGTGPEADGDW